MSCRNTDKASVWYAFITLVLHLGFGSNQINAQDRLTRADAALIIAQRFNLPHTNDPRTLYGLFNRPFPGGYDGRQDLTFYDKPLTTEVLTVVLVRHSGWDVIRYSEEAAKRAAPFVSPEGFPFYGPDPTPRSIPYIAVALDRGLLLDAELPGIRKPIGKDKLLEYLNRYSQISSTSQTLSPTMTVDSTMIRNGRATAVKPLYPSQIIVVPRGVPVGQLPESLRNPILDLRGPNLRLFSGPSSIGTGAQDYFPLGALNTVFSAGMAIPKNSLDHQGEAIYGLVENASPTVNAVGIWGASQSLASKARVWGGFFTANSAWGAEKDAQLIGLEVDVVNHTKAGIAPNASKVGIQVVGIGEAQTTNAIEILAAGPALWNNGILFSDHAISPTGTIIGVSQKDAVNLGIDISHTAFKRAAMLISNNSLLGLRSKSGADSGMYADDINNGSLVLRSGRDGTRITNNENTKNLFWVKSNGSIDRASLVYEHYFPYVCIGVLMVIGLVMLNLALLLWVARLQYRLTALEEPIKRPRGKSWRLITALLNRAHDFAGCRVQWPFASSRFRS
jgi:hypothetical protein